MQTVTGNIGGDKVMATHFPTNGAMTGIRRSERAIYANSHNSAKTRPSMHISIPSTVPDNAVL